ncbi:MAG TPA: TIGR01777 family oxidoreductase [Vicinamibacterales bacterium]|nr:TIGR01777 family oxidoreductase [Vicinamibacterales bacterium]
MRILITGATGFIGRALVPRLQRDRHDVVVWARSEQRASALLGADIDVVTTSAGHDALIAAVSRCDAVVNLSGETILGRRWTPARRAVLRASRVDVTAQLVNAIEAASSRPRVLVSGSAVGYYGDRADELLDETSSSRDDFLSRLCADWEAAAERASAFGLRVVRLRTGVVLGRAGGALTQMLPPFKAGVGGPIGSGRQYFPWIHLHDLVNLIAAAIGDEGYVGPVNAVAPDVVTSRMFARALGRALRRPAILPTPALALRGIFGEAAVVLLASQRLAPMVARRRGFVWEFPSLDDALRDVVRGEPIDISPLGSPPSAAPDASYLLSTSTVVNAPIDDVFRFFSKAANLGLITPAWMRFRIVGPIPPLADNVSLDYQVRIALVPIRWRTRIAGWNPPQSFVDVQEDGPYRVWRHEHAFAARGGTTAMEDRVYYTPPAGALRGAINRWFVAPTLREIFRYRADVIKLRFGAKPVSSAGGVLR